FHLIAVITWFAALFYMPRLFVYHAMSEDETSRERFKVMERKLYRVIMLPSMIATIALGIWLLYLNPAWLKMGWMHTKLFLVFILVGYHHVCLVLMKKFARDENTKSHVFYRWFNEIPVVFLIIIVVLAVVKPF
ncbi:MAG TPA: protoporphyrinogen oxidase HemJ, partial [Cellvibrionaceae bacterium]